MQHSLKRLNLSALYSPLPVPSLEIWFKKPVSQVLELTISSNGRVCFFSKCFQYLLGSLKTISTCSVYQPAFGRYLGNIQVVMPTL